MKRKIAILLTLALLVALLPVMHVSAAHDVPFNAILMGQLDSGEHTADDVSGSAPFSLGQDYFIAMTFDEPVSFVSDVFIHTNIPVEDSADAETTGARIISFVVDGTDLGEPDIWLGKHEYSGYMTINLELGEIEPFSALEINFIVNNAPTGVEATDEIEYAADEIDFEEPVRIIDVTPPAFEVELESAEYDQEEGGGLPVIVLVIVILILAAVAYFLFVPKNTKKK